MMAIKNEYILAVFHVGGTGFPKNKRSSSKVESNTIVLEALPATHTSCHFLTLKTIADMLEKITKLQE